MKTILAPVDFSTPSELVADTAAALAQVYAGRVVLLHVVQPPMVTNDYGVGIDNLQEIIVMSEKTATKNLEKLRARLTQAGVPTEIALHTGAPIPHILKQATDSQADFIVIDLTEAWKTMGEITGDTMDDELIHSIFSRFCVGK